MANKRPDAKAALRYEKEKARKEKDERRKDKKKRDPAEPVRLCPRVFHLY